MNQTSVPKFDDLARELESAREGLQAANRELAESVMATLDRFGLADLVRWYCCNVPDSQIVSGPSPGLASSVDRAVRKRTARETSGKRRSSTGRTKAKKGKGGKADSEEVLAWKAKLVAPLLELEAAGEGVAAALKEIASRELEIPGRAPCRYSEASIYAWLQKVRGAPKFSAKRRKRPIETVDKPYDNPQPLSRHQRLEGNDDKYRRLDCRALKRCGIIARRNQWASFGCVDCAGPKPK